MRRFTPYDLNLLQIKNQSKKKLMNKKKNHKNKKLKTIENSLSSVPSFLEYQEDKKIVNSYESEQQRLEKIKLEKFKNDLVQLFLMIIFIK